MRPAAARWITGAVMAMVDPPPPWITGAVIATFAAGSFSPLM